MWNEFIADIYIKPIEKKSKAHKTRTLIILLSYNLLSKTYCDIMVNMFVCFSFVCFSFVRYQIYFAVETNKKVRHPEQDVFPLATKRFRMPLPTRF